MSEPRLISPLLDGFALGAPMAEHHGVRCCPAIKENSKEKYIVKIISVPATQTQMDALLLAGAFKEPEEAMKYFRSVCADIEKEASFLQELSNLEGFTSYQGWQTEPITKHRLGYEVYLVGTYKRSLEKIVRKEPITHLVAMNMALDLCRALTVCRQAGAIYVDLKPGNVFLSDKKEYQIGDLGFIHLNALNYTALPEKYISSYTPPELHDPMAYMNLTVDTYGLGMILYQLYNEGSLPELPSSNETPIPAPINADYELSEIILKAIHPDPAERWQAPDKMGHAIVEYMQRNVVNDTPITPYAPIDPEAQNVQIPREDSVPEFTPTPSSDTIKSDRTESAPLGEAQDASEDASSEDTGVQEPSVEAPAPEDSSPEKETDPAEEPNTPDSEAFSSEEVVPAAATATVISDDFSRIFAKADDLLSHETPTGVVIPEILDDPDPFAFATEDSIEAADLNTPFDPVMEAPPENNRKKKSRSAILNEKRKKRFKKVILSICLLGFLAGLCLGGFWFYQNIYMQTIESLKIEGGRDSILVTVDTQADYELLSITCADSYGNIQTSSVTNGTAVFNGLIPNTMYTITAEIEGFHSLMGHTSEIFTTETTTNILSFSAVAGPNDGTAVLTISVDGAEPEEWTVSYAAEGEEAKEHTFSGHNTTIKELTLGKLYTFTLDGGNNLSLGGKTSVTFMASKLILAENLTASTTSGSDMTIRWNSPGDTVVEFWNVRCYNEGGYEKTLSVTETEVYLTEIDPSMSYIVEVTAAGMTQPARTSITANPINITGIHVDDSAADKISIQWDFSGTEPEGGWLFMYSIDGNVNLNVIKCNQASAEISPKIPEARYQFTIQSVDGTSIFNNVHEYVCPEAPGYDANAITEAQIHAYLLKTPDDPAWNYDKVGSDAFTEQFELGDPISMVLHGDTDFYLPGTNIKLLYIIRDAHGNVIPNYVSEVDHNWRSIWYTGNYHYGELNLPVIPEVAGKYQLNLYIDGFSIAEVTFTIQ